MLYGTVTEFCTPERCPKMNAGAKYEFYWEDGETYKKPTPLPAPMYVEALMSWIQNQLDDEKLFPQKIGECEPNGIRTERPVIRLSVADIDVYVCMMNPNRCSVPEKLPLYLQDDSSTTLPGLRAYLL